LLCPLIESHNRGGGTKTYVRFSKVGFYTYVVNSKSVNAEKCQRILSVAYSKFHSLVILLKHQLNKKINNEKLENLIKSIKKSLSKKLQFKFDVLIKSIVDEKEMYKKKLDSCLNQHNLIF